MPNLINKDVANNITYLNYFTALSNGVINPNVGSNSTNIPNACKEQWGIDRAALVNGTCYMLPTATSLEPKTNTTASSSNYRFTVPYLSSFGSGAKGGVGPYNQNPLVLNASNGTTGQVLTTADNYATTDTYGTPNTYEYALVTDKALLTAGFFSNGANLNTSNYLFSFSGWLSGSEFDGSIAIRSLAILTIYNNAVKCFRVSAENLTTKQNLLTSGLAQYPITCLSDTGDGTTPAADLWATELWLRDDPSGYAIGRVPHVLLAKGSTFQLGKLYYNPQVIDGITDQKIWLCVANYGTDKLLMRVFTQNISI